MGRMNVRSTYALDEGTASEIRRLAKMWGVSQAEVIRRSVHRVAETERASQLSPADVVAVYAQEPLPRDWKETEAVIASLRSLRQEGDAHRQGGESRDGESRSCEK